MLQTVPQRGLAKPRLIATFPKWQFVVFQVVGPQSLFIAETDNALMQVADNGLIDALEITSTDRITGLWWKGDLWAVGSVQFSPLIIIPQATTGSGFEDDTSEGCAGQAVM